MAEALNADQDQQPLSTDPADQEAMRKDHHFRFTAPKGYFLPSLPDTDPASFDPTTTNFGLISQSYNSDSSLLTRKHEADEDSTDWQRFAHHLSTLNHDSPATTAHHILYLARHGQGYHNLAESYYGTQAWDCYWAEQSGEPSSNITWVDAHLSRMGRHQARAQSQFWRTQLQHAKMPAPQTWYSSPMDRACQTLDLTFTPLAQAGLLPEIAHYKPTVKEFLRETNGIHTCDRRSSRATIAQRYPHFAIEASLTEEDQLWDPTYRETDAAHAYRATLLLDDILASSFSSQARTDTSTDQRGQYISLTAHGGMINALLRAIGHRPFQVRVGSAIAVLVKAERVDGKRPTRQFERGPTKPECVGDPLRAGLPGYKSLREYVDEVEGGVENREEVEVSN